MYTHYSATAPDGTTLIYHTNPNSATWHSFQSYKNNNTWTVIKEFEFDSVRGNVNKVYKFSGYDERNSSVFWALLEVIGSIVCFTCPQWDKVEALWYGKTEITVRRVYTKEKKVKNVDRILKKIFKDRMSVQFDKEPRATQLFGHGAIELVKLVKSALDFDLRSTQDDRQMVKILQLLENRTKDEQEVYIEAVKNNLLEEDRQATYTERCSALLEFFLIGEDCNDQENEILTRTGISRKIGRIDSILDGARTSLLNRKATEEAINEVLKIEGDDLSRWITKDVRKLIESLPVSTRLQCVLLANEFYHSYTGKHAKYFRHDLLQRLWDVPQEFLRELTEKMAFIQGVSPLWYMSKDMPFDLKLEYLTIITPFLSRHKGSMILDDVLSPIMKVHKKGKQFFQAHGELIYQAFSSNINLQQMFEFMRDVFSDDSSAETDSRSKAVLLLFFLKNPSLFYSSDLNHIHRVLEKYSPDDYEKLSHCYMFCQKIDKRFYMPCCDWHLVDLKEYPKIAEIFSYLKFNFFREFKSAQNNSLYKFFNAIHRVGDISKIEAFFSLFKKYAIKFDSFIYLAESCKAIDSIENYDEAIQYTSEFFACDAKDIGIGCFDKIYKLIFEFNRKEALDTVRPIVIKYPELTQQKNEFLSLLAKYQDFHDVCEQYAGFACELSKKIRNQPLFILECLAPLSIDSRANLVKLGQSIFSNKNLTSVHLSQACFSDLKNLPPIDDPNPILNVAEELLDENLEFPPYVCLIHSLSIITIKERNYVRALWTFMTQGQVKDKRCVVAAVDLITDFFDHLSIPMKDQLYSQVIAVLPYAESIPHFLSMKDRLELIDCLIDIPINEIPLIVHSLKELQLVIRSHPAGVTDSDTETIDVVQEFIELLAEKVFIENQTAYKQQILIEADKFMHACGIDINQLFALDKARLLLEIAKMDCNHGLGWERRAEVYQFFIRKIHNIEQDPLDYIEKNIPIESITNSLITVASIPPEELLSAVNSANCFINFCPKLEERLTVAAEIRRIPFESRENAILLILNALNDWKRDAPVQMTVDFIERTVMDTQRLKHFTQTISAMSAFLEMAFNSEILPLLPNDALHLILKNVIFQDKWDDILFLLNNGIKKLK